MSVSRPPAQSPAAENPPARQTGAAAGAGKINLAQRQRTVDETGEKVADVVIHDNLADRKQRKTVTSKTDVPVDYCWIAALCAHPTGAGEECRPISVSYRAAYRLLITDLTPYGQRIIINQRIFLIRVANPAWSL